MHTGLLKILCLILGQLWYMFFVLDLLSIEKLIQFDCFKDHLNKALIDQKHVYVYCLFGTGWMKGLLLQILVQG